MKSSSSSSSARGIDCHFDGPVTVVDMKETPCWLLVADIEGSTGIIGSKKVDEADLVRIKDEWLRRCQRPHSALMPPAVTGSAVATRGLTTARSNHFPVF